MTPTDAAEAGVGESAARRVSAAPGWTDAVGAATRATALEPVAWVVALAGFLARGGLALLVLPIVVLPTLTGLATVLGPLVILIALAGPDASVVPLATVTALALVVWLVGGGMIGAAADVALIRWFAHRLEHADDATHLDDGGWWGRTWRVLAVRLLAHLALLPVLAVALALVVAAVYRELTAPGDVTIPLVLRVIQAVPEAIVAVLVAWLLGEAIGALAARRVVLLDRGVWGGLATGLWAFVRSPLGSTATQLLATAGSVVVIVPAVALTSAAWNLARTLIVGDLAVVALPVVPLLVLAFTGTLAVAGLAAAWRSALWTAEDLRQRRRLSVLGGAAPDGGTRAPDPDRQQPR